VSIPLDAVPRACFEGLIPSPFATCSADGTPNITYMSIVHLIDADRVGLSRQFFNKTRANLERNPFGQLRVVDPATMQQYALDLQYLHTETEGRTFEEMKANLEAVASQQGMADVFRLRGVDVHRVLGCAAVDTDHVPEERPAPVRDLLAPLDEFVRRVGRSDQYAEATRTALEALDDLFGIRHSILLAADEDGRLFGVASNGYAASAAGAEVPAGVGLIGIAAERRQVGSVANLARTRAMSAAIRESAALPGREIPLPGLPSAQSAAAVPLVVHGRVVGVLYLESEEPGRFGPQTERLLRILGGQVAAALAVLESDRAESPESPAPAPRRSATRSRSSTTRPTTACSSAVSTWCAGCPAGSSGSSSTSTRATAGPRSRIANCASTSGSDSRPATTTSRPGCSSCASAWPRRAAASAWSVSGGAGWRCTWPVRSRCRRCRRAARCAPPTTSGVHTYRDPAWHGARPTGVNSGDRYPTLKGRSHDR
jgi:hypothetical protein